MVANIAIWKGQGQMDIMLDGFIAQTLAPFCTEKYLKIFMSSLDKQRGSLYVHNNQWLVARPATTQREKQGCVYETFDHKADLRKGTIVPQPSAIGLSKKTGVLSPTFFTQTNGTLGIPCEFPFPKRYPLHNATDLAPTVLKRDSQNARIRFSWPGYEQFHYDFRIMDKKLGVQVPITMADLVQRIMRGIRRFFLMGVRDPNTFQSNERWKLGDDGIRSSELTIIGLIHVSRGLWIPIIQLARHIIPRWNLEYYSQPHVLKRKPSEKDSDTQSEDDIMMQLDEGSELFAAGCSKYKEERYCTH